ncbi:4-coumarate--CoA ligase-like 2 [Ixodes scapularis]
MSLKARIEDGIVHSPYPGGSVPKISVCQAIKERLLLQGERTALICKENKVTSSEMLKMLHQYAAGFQSHGVKPGDKVLVHVDDSLESFIAMYGVVFAGGVVIPSELATEQDELLTKIKDGNASHVLTTPSDADLLKKLTEETHIRECFVVGDKPGLISVTKFKNVPEKSFTGPPVVDITTLFADTTDMHRLATRMVQSGIRLPSVRNVVVIAVRVTEKAAETIFSAFCLKSFRSMYGATELSNVISWMPRDTMEHMTIGFPAPNVQMKVVDLDTGKVLGPKEHGELWVKSPTNMRAYYNNPEATAEVITSEGWLRTGDIVYYDETGRFYVVERIKQFFHCMGRQVAQSEIEAVLLSHEGVEEAAVIDVPHPEYSDVAKAFVVLKPSYREPGRIRTQELQQFVVDRLAVHKHLYGGVVFVDSIPKNSRGKIDKRSLKRCA